MAIVYLVIRFSVLGLPTMGGTGGQEILNNPFLHATPTERLATVVETWGIYLVKLFAPVRLSSDYYFNQIPITSFSHPMVLAALAVNLGLLLLGIWRARKKDPIGFGILFYFISFSITSNLVVSIGTTMGERFVFIPSMGFLIAVVFGLHSLALRLRISERSFQYAMIAVVAVPFAIRTVARNQAWKDNHTLFTTDARISTRSAKIRTAAGGVMIERAAGKGISPKEKNELLHGAITHLRAAIEIYPEHGTAWILLGNAYHELKDYQNSLDAYREAIRNRPNLLESYKNAAVTARKMHQYALAGAFYKAELDKRRETHAPEDANYWFDRGKNYEDWGSQPDSAIWAYRTAIQLDPRKAEAYGQMGRVYGMQLNDLDHAIEYGEKAVALDPKLDWVFENIGIAYGMKKDYEKSIAAFLNGIRIRPTSGKLYMNLALTYQNMGDATRAQAAFAKAFELDPSLK
jgi:cytochrome c-type biogenesis protein CcmH/NrfG